MKKWLLLPFSGLLLGAGFVYFYDPGALDAFRTSLLTITFAITTFSVTFAMGAFNSSSYRQFHLTFPPRLLWSSIILLIVALTPLAVLVCWPQMYLPTCLLLLPGLVVAGPYLQEISRRETDPVVLLDSLCSLRIIEKYLHSVAPKIEAKIAETEMLELTQRGDRPTHEFDWHLPWMPDKENPLDSLATLGLLSIKQGDVFAFGRVVRRSLEALDMVRQLSPKVANKVSYKIKAELRECVYGALHRMVIELRQNKGSVSLSRVAIDVFTEFVVSKSKNHQQTQDITFSALMLMEDLATNCYKSGYTTEIRVPVIVARQIVQKGIDDPLKNQEGQESSIEVSEFRHRLPFIANTIKRIGSFAIQEEDMELLYRCFDAFGWLGCSAVKHQDAEVTKVCLRALSQLGREVRVKKLECFWGRCPVRPEDHAVERIEWMASWLVQMASDDREPLIGLFECAYSRYYGKEITLEFGAGPDGRPGVTSVHSDRVYTEGYHMRAGSREVDYSDFNFLKDLELLGFRGGIMEGPLVPLYPE